VGGIVHTHSPYATAFAAVGKPIPVYLTAIADEFGGPIPVGGFALIGGEELGKIVVDSIGRSPAVLLKNHGVFTVGKNAEDSRERRVMTEDVARTVWYALQLGRADEIPGGGCGKAASAYTMCMDNGDSYPNPSTGERSSLSEPISYQEISIMEEAAAERYALRMVTSRSTSVWCVRSRTSNLDVGRNETIDSSATMAPVNRRWSRFSPACSCRRVVSSTSPQKVDLRTYNVKRAHEHGIETVYQDRSLARSRFLWRNFFIGREIMPVRFHQREEGKGDRQ